VNFLTLEHIQNSELNTPQALGKKSAGGRESNQKLARLQVCLI